MNILAECFDTFGTDGKGLWHAQLPRGTAHSVYLPMLCQSLHKSRQLRLCVEGRSEDQLRRGKILSVLPDLTKLAYVKGRNDTYCKEIRLMTASTFLTHLRDDDMFYKLCKECMWWFVDCHSMLIAVTTCAGG